MKTSPLLQVKSSFGDKAKLVSAVQALATDALWLDRVNGEKGLAKVSNTKLLRLHAALSRAKEQFGSRDKLVGAVASLGKRAKDEGFKTRLAGYPVPRLLDLHDSLSKSSSRPSVGKAAAKSAAGKSPAGKSAKSKARTKKAKLKAA